MNLTSASDAELARRWNDRQDIDEVLDELVRRHRTWIYHLMGKWNPKLNRDDLENLTQEVFVWLCQNLHRFGTKGDNFKAWLATVARNLQRHAAEKRGRGGQEMILAVEMGPSDGDSEPFENLPDHAFGPEEIAADREVERLIWRCLQDLPKSHQEAMILHVRGLTYPEIAERMRRRSKGTVARYVKLAKERLEVRLSEFSEHVPRNSHSASAEISSTNKQRAESTQTRTDDTSSPEQGDDHA